MDIAGDRLVEKIYAASVRPELWPRALDAVGDFLGGAVLVGSVQGRAGALLAVTHRLDPERDQVLRERYVRPETNFLMAALARLPRQRVIARDAVVPSGDYGRSDLYNDVFRPQGLRHAALCSLDQGGGERIPLGVLRRARGSFDTAEAEALARLMPHLRRAMLMTVRLREAARAVAETRLLAGAGGRVAVVVDADCRVMACTEVAQALLDAGDGLFLRCGRIGARGEQGRALARAVHEAAARTGDSGGGLRIERADGTRLAVFVVPASPAAADDDCPPGAALVTAVVLGAPRALPIERLAALFGLTSAEGEVAAALFAGETPGAIAKARGVGIATVRSQLSAIYAKTGAPTAVDLVRLLGELAEALPRR